MSGLDWSDPDAQMSRHFTVREALWLNKWGRLANERDGLSEQVKTQILLLAGKMDLVRGILGLPINVHCWFRPVGYNALVGGAQGSKHLCLGPWSAVDFDACLPGSDLEVSCARSRKILEPKLEELGLRMEKHDGPWIHLDSAPVVYARYFKP